MTEKLDLIATLTERLHQKYPDAKYELRWDTPEQLLVATILAAQCTDERVNSVTETLFVKYPSAEAFANADVEELGNDVRPTGFFRNKAKSVQGACRALVDHHGGLVPQTMNEMLKLPAVARKTANVVLNNAFNIPSGVIVDTHVARVVRRLGVTENEKPEKIELDLMKLVPQDEWVHFGCALVLHGRYTCTSSKPNCSNCIFNDVCPRIDVDLAVEESEPTAATQKSGKKKSVSSKKGQSEHTVAPLVDAGRIHDSDGEHQPGIEPTASRLEPQSTKSPSEPIEEALCLPVEQTPPQAPLEDCNGLLTNPSNSSPKQDHVFPEGWRSILTTELEKPYFKALNTFVDEERKSYTIYPPANEVFTAFELVPYNEVKVLLLGQDPYPSPGHAHGLCFSVKVGVKHPASLRNMFIELREDIGCTVPNHGYLGAWAGQGLLMLNAVLTVREGEPNSHAGKGWEQFTDAVIKQLSDRNDPVVFVLWGNYAQKKSKLIDEQKHTILKAAHPSPLSVKKFSGSRPFSAINQALARHGKQPIDWQLPNI